MSIINLLILNLLNGLNSGNKEKIYYYMSKKNYEKKRNVSLSILYRNKIYKEIKKICSVIININKDFYLKSKPVYYIQ